MIFITLGSQKFQFNRILIEIDKLIEKGKITEKVFAQIGYSDYIPIHYKYERFLDRNEFNEVMNNCDKVITHGGTGAIIGAVKKGKKVIAIPRLKEFNEHVDNHQVEIVDEFQKMNFILSTNEINKLDKVLQKSLDFMPKEYISNTSNILKSIDEFIQQQN